MFRFHHVRNALQRVNSNVQLTHQNCYENVYMFWVFEHKNFIILFYKPLFIFCVRICFLKMAFARNANLCIRMSTSLRVKQLMRSKRLTSTRYGSASKATYCVRLGRSGLCVQGTASAHWATYTWGSFLFFLTWRWQSWGSQLLLHIMMTSRLSIWRFFDCPDSTPRKICPSDSMFCLFAMNLTVR